MTTGYAGAERDSALSAIAGALTEDESQRILGLFRGSRYEGAHAEDLLDLAVSHDTYVATTDDFLGEHQAELPDVPGLIYAVVAVIMAGPPMALTVINVKKLLLRARLLPPAETVLDWKYYSTPPMRAVTGYEAAGEHWRYLVTRTVYGDTVLCRWRRDRPASDLEAMREAVSTVLHVSNADEGRRLADRFEQGEDADHAVAWQHNPRPGQRVS